jgi:hypothetical protein
MPPPARSYRELTDNVACGYIRNRRYTSQHWKNSRVNVPIDVANEGNAFELQSRNFRKMHVEIPT